jgi:hypothetical protein
MTLASADESVPSARSGAIDTISFSVTPGKPMELVHRDEPAESVVARRGRLIVVRNVGKEYERAAVSIDDDEWRALLDVVAQQKLAAWKPQPTGDQAFDYATTRLFLGADAKTSTKTVNEQTWSQPLANEAQPAALAAALHALVRKRIKKPELHYFGL